MIPDIDHQGEIRNDNYVFFKLPTKIGRIISAESTIKKGEQAKTGISLIKYYGKKIGISLVVSLVIIILIGDVDNVGIILLVGIPLSISLLISYLGSKHSGKCSYVAENGFAFYEFKNSIDNITKSVEISFDDVTDLVKYSVDVNLNFSYQHTKFEFLWVANDSVLCDFKGIYTNKKREPDKYSTEYYFMSAAEKLWNKEQIIRMHRDIEDNGFIEFSFISYEDNVLERQPFIQIHKSKLDLFFDNGTYKSLSPKEIKRLYLQNGSLIIEDINYKSGLFKKNEGQYPITLQLVSNLNGFFTALENYMGYSFK